MHSQPGRFVDDHDGLVFEQNAFFDKCDKIPWQRNLVVFRTFRAHGRHPYRIAQAQLVFRFDTFLVDPDLPLPDDPIDTGARHAFQGLDEKIIDTLPLLLRADFNQPDRGC